METEHLTSLNDIKNYKESFKFEIEWKLTKKDIDELTKKDFKVVTSEKSIKPLYNSIWHLELYHHKGENNESMFELQLHLDEASTDPSNMWTNADFIFKAKEDHFDLTKPSFAWSNVERPNILLQKKDFYSDHFLSNGFLSIVCKVKVKITKKVISIMESVDESLTKLRENGIYTDVSIKIGKENYKAHRMVLAARSKYFETMFNSYFKESTSSEIELKEIEPEVFEVILSFLYSNRIPANFEKVANDLLRASHRLQLTFLTDLCESHFCKNISIENCLERLMFANLYSQNKLKREVLDFTGKNYKAIQKLESWNLLKHHYPELSKEVFCASRRATR